MTQFFTTIYKQYFYLFESSKSARNEGTYGFLSFQSHLVRSVQGMLRAPQQKRPGFGMVVLLHFQLVSVLFGEKKG